ncbi:autoinducer binding domain-containing protein [Rhizobium leguminosarum]|uniref:autoinducer binding domain-containing protein n=1 Tax=Rhizobium leguminosarum TaxID=384 RepID=UPI0010310903|nr:autoinducer binding domain-containing protein [Rhizobium leguminosarum]TBH12923.1 DNA-binding protein [Rhizobium leguminosarum]
MKRRERAVGDCAEDAAFSPSQADGAGVSADDGTERLDAMAKLAGFDFYLLSAFPRGDRTAFTENRLISNRPQSLVGFYEAADLFYCSRLVTAMKRTIVPIFCEEGSFAGSAANQENRKLNVLFQMHGLKNTFAFTPQDADLKQHIFAFSGGCPMPTREQAMALLYRCMELLDKVSRSSSVGDGPLETLTRREIECQPAIQSAQRPLRV